MPASENTLSMRLQPPPPKLLLTLLVASSGLQKRSESGETFLPMLPPPTKEPESQAIIVFFCDMM